MRTSIAATPLLIALAGCLTALPTHSAPNLQSAIADIERRSTASRSVEDLPEPRHTARGSMSAADQQQPYSNSHLNSTPDLSLHQRPEVSGASASKEPSGYLQPERSNLPGPAPVLPGSFDQDQTSDMSSTGHDSQPQIREESLLEFEDHTPASLQRSRHAQERKRALEQFNQFNQRQQPSDAEVGSSRDSSYRTLPGHRPASASQQLSGHAAPSTQRQTGQHQNGIDPAPPPRSAGLQDYSIPSHDGGGASDEASRQNAAVHLDTASSLTDSSPTEQQKVAASESAGQSDQNNHTVGPGPGSERSIQSVAQDLGVREIGDISVSTRFSVNTMSTGQSEAESSASTGQSASGGQALQLSPISLHQKRQARLQERFHTRQHSREQRFGRDHVFVQTMTDHGQSEPMGSIGSQTFSGSIGGGMLSIEGGSAPVNIHADSEGSSLPDLPAPPSFP